LSNRVVHRRWQAFAGAFARNGRAITFIVTLISGLVLCMGPAAAQRIEILRDAETEHVLKSYEAPLLVAAGLDPAAFHLYIVNDNSVNAFVAEGQNMFILTGMIMFVKTPNELIGVMAHETGHMAGGDLSRGSDAISKASVPMLVGMLAGILVMALGGGQAGMAVIAAGQDIAMAQFLQFSRSQEATADQRGMKYLNATHQSGRGMLRTFERFANAEAMESTQTFAGDHPASRDRVVSLQALVDASPYKDVKDSPEVQHELEMIQAKLRGFVMPVDQVLQRFPESDQSKQARYARSMAYFRKPDRAKALAEINSLIAEEPNNPYFYETLGQIYVAMAQPERGIAPYQKAVNLLPSEPLLRVALASAQLATDRADLAQPALDNLKVALDQQNNDDPYAWWQEAQAYGKLNNEPMAQLATAEQAFAVGNMYDAAKFATFASRKLKEGTPEWQRANDIMVVTRSNLPRR
jgi:predicted Zn-dependent protease